MTTNNDVLKQYTNNLINFPNFIRPKECFLKIKHGSR